MTRGRLAVAAVVLGLAARGAGRAAEPEAPAAAAKPGVAAGTGLSFTGGSQGYRRLSLYGDAGWKGESVDPYLWGDISLGRYSRQFSAVGGVTRDLRGNWRLGGGAGLAVGRLVDAGETGGSLLLEAEATRFFERLSAGAQWSLSAGRLGASQGAPGEDRLRRAEAFSRGALRGERADVQAHSYNELAGFLRIPLSGARLTLRLALGLPSYGEEVVSEAASLRLPLTPAIALTAGLSVEQAGSNRLYVSAGLCCRWR